MQTPATKLSTLRRATLCDHSLIRMTKIEAAVERHLPLLLAAIKNKPPGRRYAFFLPERIGIVCWIAELKPFLDFALALAAERPRILERHSPEEIAELVTRTVQDNIGEFDISPFFLPSYPPVDLFACAKPGSVERVRDALVTFANHDETALFLIPLLNRRPEVDILDHPSVVWIGRGASPDVVGTKTGITMRWADFTRFPPAKKMDYGSEMPESGSYLGVVAAAGRMGLPSCATSLALFVSPSNPGRRCTEPRHLRQQGLRRSAARATSACVIVVRSHRS